MTKTPNKPKTTPLKFEDQPETAVLKAEAAPSAYPLMESEKTMADVLKLIDENLGAQRFSPLHLPRIKVGAGGAQELRVDSPEGARPTRELTGVITAFRQARVYWKKAYGSGGGKKPPDCSSTDGFIGIGDPGGECARCPYAEFGSAVNPDGSEGVGQACKEIRQLLILLEGQLLPHMLNLPPTSIKNFMQYSLNLISAGAPYWTVVTKLTLEPATSTGGIDFGRVKFTLERRLGRDQAARLEPYHERMRNLLTPMVIDAGAYQIEAGAEESPEEREQPESETPF